MTLTVGSLFTGTAALDIALKSTLGARTVWFSEVEPASVRLVEHHRPDLQNIGDIRQVDWAGVEPVDILSGGFPCQDVSLAGKRGGLIRYGHGSNRSGLWANMARGIETLRPRLVLVENVRGLLSAKTDAGSLGSGSGDMGGRALGAVLGDLADIGYDARWAVLSASGVGAPHRRDRVFIVATDADAIRRNGRAGMDGGRRGESPNGGHPAPDARSGGRDRRRDGPGAEVGSRASRATDRLGEGSHPASDAGRDRREGDAEPDGGQTDNGSPFGDDADGRAMSGVGWGDYGPAIRRWEGVIGRPAPGPVDRAPGCGTRLSPRFVEWMMGLPEGHVVGVSRLTHKEQLKLLGNGVVPLQAEAAIRRLLP